MTTTALNANPGRNARGIALQLLSAHWQTTLAYRGMMVVWTFQSLMMPTVLLLAWLSVERLEGSAYDQGDYLLYFLGMPIVTSLTMAWIQGTFPAQIRDGTLSRDLLKPIHPLWNHVFEHIAYKVMQFIYILPAPILGFWYFYDQLPPIDLTPAHLLLMGLALALAIVLRFLMNTVIALIGFWIEHVETLNLVVNSALWAILGGMVVPVETFPPLMKQIAGLLPYRYTLSFPLEILRGHLSSADLWQGMALAIAWIVALLALSSQLWRRGLKEYSAYGG